MTHEDAAASDSPDPVKFLAELSSFEQHSKWLLSWHNQRNDAIASRCVAMLGFVGVTLALLANGLNSGKAAYGEAGIRVTAIASLGAMLVAGACCLATLTTKATRFPAISAWRKEWHEFKFDPKCGAIQTQVVDDILDGENLGLDSILDLAKIEADSRARTFKWATWALFLGLVGLASTLVLLLLEN